MQTPTVPLSLEKATDDQDLSSSDVQRPVLIAKVAFGLPVRGCARARIGIPFFGKTSTRGLLVARGYNYAEYLCAECYDSMSRTLICGKSPTEQRTTVAT